MQVSFHTYKPYISSVNYSQTQKSLHKNTPSFTSGYGAEDWEPIDNPNLPLRSNAERWRNLAKAIKMMTIDQYNYDNWKYPKPPKPLFTPEEIKKYQNAFYEDVEPIDLPEDMHGLSVEDFQELPPINNIKPKEPEWEYPDDDFD